MKLRDLPPRLPLKEAHLRLLVSVIIVIVVGLSSYFLISAVSNHTSGQTKAQSADSSTAATTAGAGPASSSAGEDPAVSAAAKASVSSTDVTQTFTAAGPGECLTWSTEPNGEVTNFERSDCFGPHRFEIASRENLGAYPTSEFGPDAARPDITRQAQLREELCQAATMRYLNGRFDRAGRYSIASILPPEQAWNSGDRTMLCGVQSTDTQGQIVETSGRAAEVDQARVYGPGTCVFINDAQELHTVDCAAPHQLEATLVIDILPNFPEGVPSIEQQDDVLRGACTQGAMDYLGGEENLYQSTLQPYWVPLPESAWVGGSHSANCYLAYSTPEGAFGMLTGTSKDMATFQINGAPVTPPPTRNPLKSGA